MVNSILHALGASENDEPLSVRFVNTVGSRRSAAPNEYLATPADLRDWLARRGFAEAEVDEPFRLRALQFRDGLYRIFSVIAAGQSPREEDLEVLNSELCEALAKLELAQDLGWVLRQQDQGERAMMLIALSATDLLTSTLVSRIRECADEGCGWIFVDHSKNRTRRWCSMSDCGNLAKARRFQERKRKG